MEHNNLILVQNWMDKSLEALNDGKTCIDNNMLTTAQNRLYYAIFYSVVALGYLNNFITSKHTELIGWFNKKYIKANIFPINMGKVYKKTFDNRHKNDYTINYKPDKNELKQTLLDVEIFIDTIKKYIESNK